MDLSSVRREDGVLRSVGDVLDVGQAVRRTARSRYLDALLMTTRKVTAIEEKVLAAAKAYAEAHTTYSAAVEVAAKKHGRLGCALRPEPVRMYWELREAEYELTKHARLLKQRRAKVKK
jgi:hypothetical protein